MDDAKGFALIAPRPSADHLSGGVVEGEKVICAKLVRKRVQIRPRNVLVSRSSYLKQVDHN